MEGRRPRLSQSPPLLPPDATGKAPDAGPFAVTTSVNLSSTLRRDVCEMLMESLRRRFGRWRWSVQTRVKYRLRHPKTLNEKIQYKMAFDRRPILTTFADKWAVREYVARKAGRHLLTEVYSLLTDPGDVALASIPDRCVIKPTHGSGSVILVDEHASESTLPDPATAGDWLFVKCRVRRRDLDQERLRRVVNHWLNSRYPMAQEWAYHNITPQVFVEEYIDGQGAAPPADYKFFVMHGKVAFIQVDMARFEGHRRQLFYPTWEPIPVDYVYPRPDALPQRPGRLKQMLDVASILGEDTDFVRVDLYEAAGCVRFGELTNCPAAGRGSFSDARFAKTLAESWIVPRSYASFPSTSVAQTAPRRGQDTD